MTCIKVQFKNETTELNQDHLRSPKSNSESQSTPRGCFLMRLEVYPSPLDNRSLSDFWFLVKVEGRRGCLDILAFPRVVGCSRSTGCVTLCFEICDKGSLFLNILRHVRG